MNHMVSQIRKRLLSSLCVLLLMGGILFATSSALAISLLPSGEYDLPDLHRPVLQSTDPPYSPYAGRPADYQPSHPE